MKKGFTVIELLVVIAIIGLLSSIVLVSLSGTRDRAKIAKTLLYSSEIYHALGSDIVGNWNFDEGSGTTALDSSGYQNHGTIFGATYTSETPQKAAGQGSGKYALSFDGVNDYVSVADSNNLDLDELTITAWVKAANTTDDKVVLTKGDVTSVRPQYGVWIRGTDGFVRTQFRGNQLTGITSLEDDAWHYVTVTLSNSADTMRIYIDGAVDASMTNATANIINNDTAALEIGRYVAAGTPGGYFSGRIDDARVYGAVLTAVEVQKLYAEGLEKHKDLAIK